MLLTKLINNDRRFSKKGETYISSSFETDNQERINIRFSEKQWNELKKKFNIKIENSEYIMDEILIDDKLLDEKYGNNKTALSEKEYGNYYNKDYEYRIMHIGVLIKLGYVSSQEFEKVLY